MLEVSVVERGKNKSKFDYRIWTIYAAHFDTLYVYHKALQRSS